MKHLLTKITCAVLLTLIAVTGYTQQNVRPVKQALFTKQPSTINCTADELSKFFAVAQGADATVSFSNTFKTKGIVAGNTVKYKNLQSLAIKLPEFNNAIFSLSKRIDKNNNVVYTGRIINQANADAYLLKQIDANKYQLIKTDLETILPTCAQ
ncbi:hypothetical protein LK994_02420 [Ferruginibacter lapsinanis]|uniref:hypothetical protein n=1 Tax=Ferruginibacter lapsinanis TaxID=563172 RepID=UPI001E2EFFA6|nr:hypothetical protein [Ferruginibacter lapsinanis]UEG50329.1 hypothetical protein LK994_02420 [Ferruginibacter lapsinanis]